MSDVIVREAGVDDRIGVEKLLAGHELPIPDPDDTPVHFLVAEQHDVLVGACGWEAHGEEVLLRSVAVADSARGSGVGSRLVAEALRALDEQGVPRVVLVTLDAAEFFARFAFTRIDKDAVPPAIRDSTEYRIHECAGGHWMVREP